MRDLSSVLASVSVVSVFVSVLSLCFPNNIYKPHLFMLSRIIIVSIFVCSLTSIKFDFDLDNEQITTDHSVFNEMINERICGDIDSYIESVFDTDCSTEIVNSEVTLSVTNGNIGQITDAVYNKFGIKCRVIKIE
ncbi:MAG: hypothetical protein IIW73_04235 [Clostridia bacterium]|nr:hypothetical protein [Clostridia bacterium]